MTTDQIVMWFCSLLVAFASGCMSGWSCALKAAALRLSCADCGMLGGESLVEKADHHGGTKRVCLDRDACHARSG